MKVFEPTCTFPSEAPSGFVDDANLRSTMDVVWSCLSIIFLSTCRYICSAGRWGWMGIMLVFPEYLVGTSATNLFSAWINTPHLKELVDQDGVPWTLSHTILAELGGIAIRFSDASQQPSLHAQTIPDFLRSFQKNQSSYLQNLGDIPWEPYKPHVLLAANAPTKPDLPPRLVNNYRANHIAPLHGNIWILDSYQLILARRLGVVGQLPYIRAEEIADRSKTDGIVRLIAAIQVLWLAVQLVVRRVHDIPFTALEISTVAFSSCAFIIYLIEWHKPKDISLPIYLDTSAVVTPDVFSQIADAVPVVFLQARHYYMPQSGFHLVHQDRFARKHLDQLMVVMTMVAIVLFAGIHLFVWDSHFPTPTERLLWRIAAITMAVAPISSAVLVSLESVLFQRTLYMSVGSVAVLTPIYLASRMFIMVESFRSLYFMPPEAFIATWTSNAPHVG
ncbi:hypothetical protein V8F33_013775 [Rhypophila sp. PSN 637]